MAILKLGHLLHCATCQHKPIRFFQLVKPLRQFLILSWTLCSNQRIPLGLTMATLSPRIAFPCLDIFTLCLTSTLRPNKKLLRFHTSPQTPLLTSWGNSRILLETYVSPVAPISLKTDRARSHTKPFVANSQSNPQSHSRSKSPYHHFICFNCHKKQHTANRCYHRQSNYCKYHGKYYDSTRKCYALAKQNQTSSHS